MNERDKKRAKQAFTMEGVDQDWGRVVPVFTNVLSLVCSPLRLVTWYDTCGMGGNMVLIIGYLKKVK